MNNNEIKQQPNQSLARALTILEQFTPDQSEWGIRELGRELGVNPTTVHRLVATFHAAGYLEQNPVTQRYRLGPKVIKLASLYTHSNPISSMARRVFEQYAGSFAYNFYLGQLNGFEVIYLAALDGRGPIKIVVEPGGSTSLHATALGKVLLAFQDTAFVDEFIAQADLHAFTSRSITAPDDLRQQLQQIREQQYAVNDGEFYNDVGAVGVPVFDQPGQTRLGVSLAYPRHLIQEQRVQIDELVDLARQIASDITLHTGYPFQSY